MPCCICVQSICERSDGSTWAIFEHDDEEADEWFAHRPKVTVNVNDTRCSLIEVEKHLAATWRRGKRHITLVGMRDATEVSQLVAWLGQEGQHRTN